MTLWNQWTALFTIFVFAKFRFPISNFADGTIFDFAIFHLFFAILCVNKKEENRKEKRTISQFHNFTISEFGHCMFAAHKGSWKFTFTLSLRFSSFVRSFVCSFVRSFAVVLIATNGTMNAQHDAQRTAHRHHEGSLIKV